MPINKKVNIRALEKRLKQNQKAATIALENKKKEKETQDALEKINNNISALKKLAEKYEEAAYNAKLAGKEKYAKDLMGQVVDLEITTENLQFLIDQVEIAQITATTFGSMTTLPDIVKDLTGDLKKVDFNRFHKEMGKLQDYIKSTQTYLSDFRKNMRQEGDTEYEKRYGEEDPDVVERRNDRIKEKLEGLNARIRTENVVQKTAEEKKYNNDTYDNNFTTGGDSRWGNGPK